MSYTTTSRLALQKAVVGSNQAFETSVINSNWDKVDAEAVAADVRLDSAESRLGTAEADIDALQAAVGGAGGSTVRTVAGTTDTLLSTDANDIVRFTSGSEVAVSVPNVLTVGQRVDIVQDGAGQVVFTAGSGVTLVGAGTKTAAQYAGATVLCVASGEYRLIGNIA